MKRNLILFILLLGLLRQGFSCDPGYYDAGSGDCQPCEDEGCITCSGPGTQMCSACDAGSGGYGFTYALLNGVECTKLCQEGCKSCTSADSSYTCDTCLAGYYMDGQACKRCPGAKGSPEGSTTSAACVNCADQENCWMCSGSGANQCLVCYPGYPQDGVCNLQCDDANCIACTGEGTGVCTDCTPSIFFRVNFETNTCENSCPLGYSQMGYADSSSVNCWECLDSNCDRCLQVFLREDQDGKTLEEGYCYQCAAGYFLVPGPYPDLPKDYDLSGFSGSCSKCSDTNCVTCSATGTGKCTQCQDGYFEKDGLCTACQDKNCLACSGAGTGTCTTCSSGLFPSSGKCVGCQDTGCSACTGAGTGVCSSCAANYYIDSASKTCTSCGVGKYSIVGSTSQSNCKTCSDKNCDACSGSGTGVCTTCAKGYRLSKGKCVACDDTGCLTCSGAGTAKCSLCDDTYYLTKSTCKACADTGCKTCSGSGTKTCKACTSGFYLSKSTCKACDEKGCGTCSGAGTGKCSACKASYYFDKKSCVSCGTGKYSPAGSTSSSDCKDCKDTNCLACTGAGTGTCSSCAAGYYLDSSSKTCKACPKGTASDAGSKKCSACADESCTSCSGLGLNKCSTCAAGTYLNSKTKTCTSCGAGKFSAAGSTSSSGCKTCADSNCATCNALSKGSCTSCSAAYYLAKEQSECSRCTASDCDVCSPNDPSTCTTCSLGYKLIAGRKDCIPVNGLITISVDGETRYEMTMDEYNSYGAKNYYLKLLASSTGIDISRFKITKIGVGSVIINYSIQTSGEGTLEEQKAELEQSKAALDTAMKSGTMNAFGGVRVLNHESGIVVTLPEDESKDTEDKDSKHLGAILGGVLGGLALIVAVGLLIGFAYKKGYLKRASKSPQSAKYNMATSNPTSPDTKQTLKSET